MARTAFFRKKRVDLLFTEYAPFYTMSDRFDVDEGYLHYADLRPDGERFRILCRVNFKKEEPWLAFLEEFAPEIEAFKAFAKRVNLKINNQIGYML